MLTKEQREAIYRLALQQQHADLSDYLDSMTQRVPLSDEQIRALVQPMDWPPSVTEIVRAVEQAHGITPAAQED